MRTYQLVIAYSFIGVGALVGTGAWYKRWTRMGLAAGGLAAVGLILVTVLNQVDPQDDGNEAVVSAERKCSAHAGYPDCGTDVQKWGGPVFGVGQDKVVKQVQIDRCQQKGEEDTLCWKKTTRNECNAQTECEWNDNKCVDKTQCFNAGDKYHCEAITSEGVSNCQWMPSCYYVPDKYWENSNPGLLDTGAPYGYKLPPARGGKPLRKPVIQCHINFVDRYYQNKQEWWEDQYGDGAHIFTDMFDSACTQSYGEWKSKTNAGIYCWQSETRSASKLPIDYP